MSEPVDTPPAQRVDEESARTSGADRTTVGTPLGAWRSDSEPDGPPRPSGPGVRPRATSATASRAAPLVGSVRVRRRAHQFEGRQVRRLVRHVDPWSVLKCALVFFVCVWIMFMVAGVITWTVAASTGTVDKLISFIQQFGFEDVKLTGTFLMRQYALIGLVLTFAATLASAVGAVVFNLISDLIGGVWITVVEEETARPISG